MNKLAENFLKKRTKQKDTLCITKGEAISGLIDFAKQVLELAAEEAEVRSDYYNKENDPKEFDKYIEEDNISERQDMYGDTYAIDVRKVDKNSILKIKKRL